MTTELNVGKELVIDRPRPRRPLWGYLTMLAAVLSVGGAVWAWELGYRPAFLAPSRSAIAVALVEVDRGDVIEYIVENGALESATNTVIRCEVEALLGMVGGTTGAGAGAAGTSRSGTSGSAGQGGASASTSAGGGQAGGASGSGGGGSGGGSGGGASAKAKSKASAGSSSGSSKSSSGSGSSSGSSTSGGSSSSASSGTSTASSGSGSAGGKPVIRSFSYTVAPHTPLRGSATKSTTTTAAGSSQTNQSSGGGGGGGGGGGRGGGGGGRGGRGGRGGGGGGMMEEEKPGSTRIVTILPEGTLVTKDQVVCQFDSSAFEDELKAQLVRYAQAKSWVDQVRSILEVNQITQREYRDGIYPQDLQLIRRYIQTCRVEKERAQRNAIWSRDMAGKGYRTQAQLKADVLSEQQTSIALEEAEGMLERLDKFTGPKILKSLEAKIKAIESDKKNQEASFELEKQRLARLQKCIDKCTLRAPGNGILVYAQQSNGWGRVEASIDQGVTVREGQPIFQLPDPKHMRVRTRINETKVSHLRPGQQALIRVDAFPDRPLHGTVGEITAISTPVNGPFSDVRIYYATVNIEEGFADLRPGLTAEVLFKCDTRSNVTRVPIQAIRPIEGVHYVALHQSASSPGNDLGGWHWKRVELGLSDPDYVEVVSGLEQGDRVLADPHGLPVPKGMPDEQAGPSTVATVTLEP
jgi:HlyD family secretion protein